MPAKDIFHDKVRRALEKDGWTITDDPYSLKWDDNENLFVDLAAEKLLTAQKNDEKIAVEIKTFIGKSTIHELHVAVGQYIVYRTAIEIKENDRVLFLAVPMEILRDVFSRDKAGVLIAGIGLKLLGFDVEKEVIVEWKK